MSVGTSGRVVIEVDPEIKQLMYAALRDRNLTLKCWFVATVQRELLETRQLSLQLQGDRVSAG